jgi:hypothetical protein
MCQVPSVIFSCHCRARTANHSMRRGMRAHHVSSCEVMSRFSPLRSPREVEFFCGQTPCDRAGIGPRRIHFQGEWGNGHPHPIRSRPGRLGDEGTMERWIGGSSRPGSGTFSSPIRVTFQSVNGSFGSMEPKTRSC